MTTRTSAADSINSNRRAIYASILFAGVGAADVLAQPSPAWNRRLTGIALTADEAGGFDVTAQWRIDLEGSSSAPVELGTAVDLSVNGGAPTTTESEDCLIWDIVGPFGPICAGQPDGTICGSASISGTPVDLTCDAETETCSTPVLTGSFPIAALADGDEITALLSPTAAAMSDSLPNDDDDGLLTFGSWNRKIVSVDVAPTPGGGPNQFDVSAEVVLEIDGDSTVPLDLSIDTEPAADECCQEACCCPSCSTECNGGGCGGNNNLVISNIGASGKSIAPPCTGPPCGGACATGTHNGTILTLSCDPSDCICRSGPVILTWTGLTLLPNDDVFVILRPAPGALPELPPFDDDSMTGVVPGVVPAISDWGVAILALLTMTAGTVMFRRTNRPLAVVNL